MSTLTTVLVSSAVGATASAVVLVAGNVALQDVSPGTVQTGHTNISGYALAGRFGAGVSPTLAKVQVEATGSLQGVRSISDTGVAVYGQSNAASGLGAGGYFTSKSVGGRAAIVDQLAPTGATIGLFANAVSPDGTGIFGRGKATGIYGEVTGNSGAGIYGKSTSTAQQTSGGLFEATGSGRGIVARTFNGPNSGSAALFEGEAINTILNVREHGTGIGIAVGTVEDGTGISVFVGSVNSTVFASNTGGVFRSDATNGIGANGYGGGAGGKGVRATTPSGTGYGLLAENTGGGAKVAIRAVGNTEATGTKAFIIDHPLAPAHKYLKHFSAEGPEPYLIYRGVARLDGTGKVWVTMPSYFSSIAAMPHYQLTGIGSASPVYVATEMQGNRFQIGGQAGMKVCWTVTAVRNDATVRKYGYKTEIVKDEEERGKYLDPSLYGAKPEAAIHPETMVLRKN